MRTLLTSALFIGLAASPVVAQHAGHGGGHGGGQLPPGWQARTDRPTQNVSELMFMAMGGGYHVRTGPPVILWNPEHTVSGNFEATATFTQPSAPERMEAYGIFIGGSDLDADNQKYTYLLIRHDGRFIVKYRDAAEAPTIVPWTESNAVQKPDANGRSTNTLSIQAGADRVRFLVNGTEVHSMARSELGAVNGIAGLRVNHGLDVMVDSFEAKGL